MAKNRNTPSVRFRKTGIFVDYDDGQRRIGDPIRVLALGHGLQDQLSYTVLELRDRDQQWRKAVVRSSLLTARTIDFKEQLTDVYNYRLPNKKYTSLVIDELAAQNPKRRIDITAVPGWQGNSRYAHPRRNIKVDGDDWDCLFADDPNVLMGEFICKGTLNEWKQEVARHCRLSSRLRLAVGVPFAATILRRLGVDTFGFHFVGTTSHFALISAPHCPRCCAIATVAESSTAAPITRRLFIIARLLDKPSGAHPRRGHSGAQHHPPPKCASLI